jgi:hypothetical protein
VQKEGRRPTHHPLSSGLNFLELREAEVRRIRLLRTLVNRGLQRVVGRPLAPGARFVYSRARV